MEILDVYDYDGNKKGYTAIRGQHSAEGDWFKCIHAYIVTPDLKFLIQRRSLEKQYFPGIWDITTGTVLSGEESLDTAIREVKEELGLDVSSFKTYLVGKSRCYDCLNDIYVFVGEFDMSHLTLQKEEVMDAKLISIDEMLDLIENSNFKDDEYYRTLFDFFNKLSIDIKSFL